MNYRLNHLQPAAVWQYFEDICQIPHPSKQEEKLSAFLMDFAKKNKLEPVRIRQAMSSSRKRRPKGLKI